MFFFTSLGACRFAASPQPQQTPPSVPMALPELEAEKSNWEWTKGEVAAGMMDLLAPVEPLIIEIPDLVANRITTPTAVFYFSPTCPHCQNVMVEINRLQESLPIDWLGVASSNSDPEIVELFVSEYKVAFPMVVDEKGEFAANVGARATPNVYIMAPGKKQGTVELRDYYTPFSRGLGPVLAMQLDRTNPFAHFKGYQGFRACAVCHMQEAKSWATTHHAFAYHTLYSRDKAGQEKCVGCHVTGMGDGGFELGDHGSPLVDVGCESCHGPSGPHDGDRSDAKKSCINCHDAEHSIGFSVEKGMPHIDHFVAKDYDADMMRSKAEAIVKGEAPRPLLALPEGKAVGSAQCNGCHENVHLSDPHVNAMTTLSEDERDNLECVRCHATAKNSVPPPTDLSGYHVDEGVGCESCHGPGEAHVANPGLDNIVRLGESCPECVLEALCTSCHTSEWDAEWDLTTRIEMYGKRD